MIDWLYTYIIAMSIVFSWISGSGQALSSAVLEGAGEGLQLGISLAGPLVLWSGIGKLMDRSGVSAGLVRRLQPLLSRLFPEMKRDPVLSQHLCGNFCANLLGLGNAATPRGIQAALRLKPGASATDSLCRLVVLNTASIQLSPTSVAAIRSGLGAAAPFDILPCVWITSLCSAGLGLTAAWAFGKLWGHD